MWIIMITVFSHVIWRSGSEEAHIEQLLRMLAYGGESTEAPPSTAAGPPPPPPPFFEDAAGAANVTAQLGTAVALHCKVNDLTPHMSVSWLRRVGGGEGEGGLRLLSVGSEPYSPDGRYSAAFVAPNDWQLRLRYAQHQDQGRYECQVSSHPPIAYLVYLHVVVPELEIADERGLAVRHKFYNEGSTIELKCAVSRVTTGGARQPPAHVLLWRHGQRVLNYDTTRGGISVKTDILETGAKSRLFIANAAGPDSGDYSCALGDVRSAPVLVHVLNGDTPAAMQHGGGAAEGGGPGVPLLLAALALTTAATT